MSSYAFWNNKGGVGKSFLCFITACEYANKNSDSDVYVLDLCPQANVSETLLGGFPKGSKVMVDLVGKAPAPRIAGYLDARLNSPFRRLDDIEPYICRPHDHNRAIPGNLSLVCGDNLLEIQSEAIRQTSQLAVPADAWKQVLLWINDLANSLTQEAMIEVQCSSLTATRVSRSSLNLRWLQQTMLLSHSLRTIVPEEP